MESRPTNPMTITISAKPNATPVFFSRYNTFYIYYPTENGQSSETDEHEAIRVA